MTLNVKSFDQLVSDLSSGWVQKLLAYNLISEPIQLEPGDAIYAVFQTIAQQMDFLQGLAQIAVSLSRASTSSGADLDTWMADFSFSRLPATFATGSVFMGKLSASSSVVSIPTATLVNGTYTGGAFVQTVGGAIIYQVIPDATQSSFNATSGVYQIPAGSLTVSVTVQAVVGGSQSNVIAGALTQLGSSVSGVDFVTNPFPINNGIASEPDDAFRARFVDYLASLAKGTYSAIISAIRGVQQGLLIALIENVTAAGQPLLGSFTAIVDDGSGAPPASLLASIIAAVNQTRAFSVQAFVTSPTIDNILVQMAVRTITGFVSNVVQTNVQTALSAFISTLTPGATLFIGDLIRVAYTVSGVAAVQASSVQVNGVQADYTPVNVSHEVRAPISSITVGSY